MLNRLPTEYRREWFEDEVWRKSSGNFRRTRVTVRVRNVSTKAPAKMLNGIGQTLGYNFDRSQATFSSFREGMGGWGGRETMGRAWVSLPPHIFKGRSLLSRFFLASGSLTLTLPHEYTCANWNIDNRNDWHQPSMLLPGQPDLSARSQAGLKHKMAITNTPRPEPKGQIPLGLI